LLKDIESAALFSLALDESTDRTDIGQLVVWVRFPKGDTFSYEMLSLLPLTNQTRGQDIHSAVTIFFMDQVKPSTWRIWFLWLPMELRPWKEKGVIALLRNDPEIPKFFIFLISMYFAPRTIVQQNERWRAQSDDGFRNQNRKFDYGTHIAP